MIVGIDEVGRGAWAGPLVVGAVCLGGGTIDGLTDSKLLSKKRRQQLSLIIKQQAVAIGIGWVSARDIDVIGLSKALEVASKKAVSQIDLDKVDSIIIDGTVNFLVGSDLQPKVATMKKADLVVPSVSAASIIAKVARDEYMAQCHGIFPEYGFHRHVGYGAATHKAAIDSCGIVPIHRLSFAPMKFIASAVNADSHMQNNDDGSARSSQHDLAPTSIGSRAESVVSSYLTAKGHQIIETNWKTRWCEIDIVSLLRGTIYFTEVKYRKNGAQGGGMAAITPAKLRQMKFAAELWLQRHPGHNARLSCVEVTGEEYEVSGYVQSIE